MRSRVALEVCKRRARSVFVLYEEPYVTKFRLVL